MAATEMQGDYRGVKAAASIRPSRCRIRIIVGRRTHAWAARARDCDNVASEFGEIALARGGRAPRQAQDSARLRLGKAQQLDVGMLCLEVDADLWQ
jgi:hypothetical protein